MERRELTYDPVTGELIVPLRLQKYLARCGVASRRGSEDLMTAGRVCVNGVVTTELGTKIDPLTDVVTVDGAVISRSHGMVYLMLNKPAGYITTMDDPQGRPTVASLVPTQGYPGLFPVGRLDKDTTGILLFMTDGILARDLLHPKMHVNKVYHATVEGRISDNKLQPLRDGIELDDGPCAPAQARVLTPQEVAHDRQAHLKSAPIKKIGSPRVTHVELIIHEGRKRQVKRMMSALGHPVCALHRHKFGPLSADGVDEGSWRMLTSAEVTALKKAVYGS